MSLAALLQATRDTLRITLRLPDNQCKVSQDAQPDPTIGRLFCSVFPSDWRPGGPEVMMGIDESYGVTVGLTFMASHIPVDRTEDLYLNVLWGMEATARQVMVAIHQEWDVIALANQIITDRAQALGNLEPVNKFVEPLRWLATDTVPQPKYGDWIFSKETDKVCAYLLNVYFGQARRLQSTANMT